MSASFTIEAEFTARSRREKDKPITFAVTMYGNADSESPAALYDALRASPKVRSVTLKTSTEQVVAEYRKPEA